MAREPGALTEGLTEQSEPRRSHDRSSPQAQVACDEPDREARLFEILTAYLQSVESGQSPRRQELLDSHPEFADDLAAFLDEENRLHRLIEPLRSEIDGAFSADPGPGATDGMDDDQRPESSPRPGDAAVGLMPRDFGEYALIEVIGSGGMGVVFRARHKGLDRHVALKMIRGGDLAAEEDLRRFRLEAGASAQLDHPHIVPIYEVGELHGHLYYVMKLFEGGSLDRRLHEYADDPRATARLVAAVARAVHHAHQRGVLHRDLKPSNILIDNEGRGHVADFGLAKRLGVSSDATQTGLIIGTPSYMAPEQASGQRDAVTIATDVYGLGALLYSLLAGRPPFRGDSILDTIEQVRLREPDRPTTVSGRVERDLETICLTCLRKEPHRRYGSAAAMADDLDRWNAGEPIAARPIGHGERAWRWARREPLSAGLASALVVLSVLAIAGLVASNVIIGRERDLARIQRRIAIDESRHAEIERQRALERSRQARRAVDEMYTEVAEKWLYDQPKLSQVQREFLEKALAFYEQFSLEQGNDPAVALEQSKALSRLAWLQLRLGRPQDGESTLYKPVEILQSLVEKYPDRPVYLDELGKVLATLASRFSEQKRWNLANPARENALAAYENLVKGFPFEPRYRIELATNQAQLGLQYQLTGRTRDAQRLGSNGLATVDRLQTDFPGRSDPNDLSTRMRVLEDVGCILTENRRFSEAENALRQSIDIAEHLPDRVISHQDLLHRIGHTNLYLGYLLGRVGRWREAEPVYIRARDLFERLAADFPDLPLYQVDVVDAQLGMVDVARETGRQQAAEQSARAQVEQSERLVKAHPDLVNCRRTLLAALTRWGRLGSDERQPRKPESAYSRALVVAEQLAAAEPSGVYPQLRLGSAQLALGGYLVATGRTADAVVLVARAIETLEASCRDYPDFIDCQQTLGEALAASAEFRLDAGHNDEAHQAFTRALSLFRGLVAQAATDPELTERCVRGLTSCPLPQFRDPSRAVELATRASLSFPRNRLVMGSLGLARYRADDWTGAIAALAPSAQTSDALRPADWLVLAMAYDRAGDRATAQSWFERAVKAAAPDVVRGPTWQRLHEEARSLLSTQ